MRGSRKDAVAVLRKVQEYLRDSLKLTVNLEKSKITNLRRDRALFLGSYISRSHVTFSNRRQRFARLIRFEAPLAHITDKLTSAGFMINGVALPRFQWLHNSKDAIIGLYNGVIRGYLNYYSFAGNYSKLVSMLLFHLKDSCTRLLAAKFSLRSRAQVYKKYGKDLRGKDMVSFISPSYRAPMGKDRFRINALDSVVSLYAKNLSAASLENLSCAKCGSNIQVEMHHIRHMKNFNPKLSNFDRLMVERKRKQIPLCRKCHLKVHNKKPKL